MKTTVYAIEGLDRLGKSTLIKNIQRKLGHFQSIHFTKPPSWLEDGFVADHDKKPEFFSELRRSPFYTPILGYQAESFANSMQLARSGARIMFDRWHLGEYVYAPMYRKYSGNYVFDLEDEYDLDKAFNIRLILLTEDFKISKHFVDDGESLGGEDKREQEQDLFIEAFNKSSIRDKRIISVTDPETGKFLPEQTILELALR